MPKEEIIKCKCIVKKHGIERECGRFLIKRINKKQLHVKCSSCGSYAIITAHDGGLDVVHIKEDEEILCQ